MNIVNDCKSCNNNETPINNEAIIKAKIEARKPEPTGNDVVEPKSCGNCIHQTSCGAYWLTKKMVNEFHREFQSWIRWPFTLTMLALNCTQFTDKRKVIKPDNEVNQ